MQARGPPGRETYCISTVENLLAVGGRSGGFDNRGSRWQCDTLEKRFDDLRLSDGGDLLHLVATMATGEGIDEQDTQHDLGPWTSPRVRLGEGHRRLRYHEWSQPGVGGQDTVIAYEVFLRRRNERTEFLDQLERLENDMGGAVGKGALESV